MIKPSLTFLLATASLKAQLPADHAERMAKGLDMFKEVSGLLKEHCVKCHGGEKTRADFDLATREGLLAGVKDGVTVVPFNAAGSKLMKLIRHEEEPSMPDKKPKLSDATIAKIAAWIDHGAPYDAPLVAGKTPPRDKSKVTAEDRKWWAFQPLANLTAPADASHPLDAFLLSKAAGKKLTLNPPAEPRAFVRRAFLNALGLPPSPDEVETFAREYAANAEAAVATLTDKLLASPQFGERWARHWLDVARFAESSGFEHDYDRPNAWHYRDFVIRALNSDMPFDQFVDWQLAGDEFAPGNAEAMTATGFLGAGVFPTQITANEVERVRYDALDDMLSTTGSAMLGLTIGCARCHDHKYDPIPAQDYYRLLSTFTTTVRSNVDLDTNPQRTAEALAKHKAEHDRLTSELSAWETATLQPKFDEWLRSNPELNAKSPWVLAGGTITSKGGAQFKALPDGSWLAEGPNAASDTYVITASSASPVTALKLEALTDPSMKGKGPGRASNGNFALSRIRVTAGPNDGGKAQEVKLAPGAFTHQQNADHLSVAASLDNNASSGWAVDGQIGKNHAAIFTFADPATIPGGAKLTVTLEFAVNTSHSIGRPRLSLCTGGAPVLDATAIPAEIAALAPKLNTLSATERTTLFNWWKQNDAAWKEKERKVAEHTKAAPKTLQPVLICAEGYEPLVMHSQGPPFLKETHILKRGDTNQKTATATQSFLQVLMRDAEEKRWAWKPSEGSKSSGRRRSLANWMTDVEHGGGALLARVAVNRLWQHHFGRGIVSTPNDFGKQGTLPSHPELLDWLAGELIRNGWKLKPIHRLIMTSAAYRQSSAASPEKLAADPDNSLFLRAMPRRLEAEAARDAILSVSGQLDLTPFGRGTLDENSRRRSIYFTVKRSQLVNSMVVFDAPEPLSSQGQRPTTTVAPQALFLMNSPQARNWAGTFATKLMEEKTPEARVHAACLRALGRRATPDELAAVLPFLEKQSALHRASGQSDPDRESLTDYCQALFGLNEFLYIP
ncbi:MAG TPA: PSD1 and planctomycete cytochrome C domain-containing protein [Verrucomicrobiales bacterium]|nr:PSD1 and planctomycete cytochrome C domain-containing protein [Verrucomicrobiales bacterium]